MSTFKDLTGKKFGRLLVKNFMGIIRKGSKTTAASWLCLCDCGSTTQVITGDLHSGHKRSCGCLFRECSIRLGKSRMTHGHTCRKDGGYPKSKTYVSWRAMKKRCLDSRSKDFKNYGGRGITVCERWLNSEICKKYGGGGHRGAAGFVCETLPWRKT